MKFILIILLLFSFQINSREIPTLEKIYSEKYIEIKDPFYACVYEIKFEDYEDLFETKKILSKIILGDENIKIDIWNIPEFFRADGEDLEFGDERLPKRGDCYAFYPSYSPLMKFFDDNTFAGYVEVYEQQYTLNKNIEKKILKSEITVDQYYQEKISYGSKRVKLTGLVEKIGIAKIDDSIYINLVSKNGKTIIAGMFASEWKNNDKIKKQLRAIKEEDIITLKGYFESEFDDFTTFRILKIIDNTSLENNNNSSILTDEDVSRIDFIISFLPEIEPTANLICTQKVYLENSKEERKNIFNFFNVIKKITQNNINDQKEVEDLFKEVELNMDKVDEINQKFYNCF